MDLFGAITNRAVIACKQYSVEVTLNDQLIPLKLYYALCTVWLTPKFFGEKIIYR